MSSIKPNDDEYKAIEERLVRTLPEFAFVARQELHQHLYLRLLENFRRVQLTISPHLCEPKPNLGPLEVWSEIVRLSCGLFNKSLSVLSEEASRALFRSLVISGGHFSIESSSLRDVATGLTDSAAENTLRRILILYHDMYDGRYRTALSYHHFLIEKSLGQSSATKSFSAYLNDDVSYMLKAIREIGNRENRLADFEMFCSGADSHIRNAVAHRRWNFGEDRVTLSDIDGWEQSYDYGDLETLVKRLSLTTNALEAGEVFAFASHQEQVARYVKDVEYDLKAIKKFMSEFADFEGYELTALSKENERELKCILKDANPASAVQPSTDQGGDVKPSPRIEPWKERTIRLVRNCFDVLRAYEKLTILVYDQTDKLLITFNVELKRSESESQHGMD